MIGSWRIGFRTGDTEALGFQLGPQHLEQLARAQHLERLRPVRADLPAMRRSPRPITCSGRILAVEVKGRSPSTTVTLRTSQPSRSIITLTMALILLSALSMSRAAWRALSRSPLLGNLAR